MKKIRKADFVQSRDVINVSPGEMLASLRELQGLSQNELARQTDIAQANISNMEQGRCKIGRERAIVLARVLKVHPAVILFPNYEVEYEAKAA